MGTEHRILGVLSTALVVACGEAPTGAPRPTQAPVQHLSSAGQGVTTLAAIESELQWQHGSNPTYLGNADSRTCFLTRVGGKFTGSTEAVYIYQANGGWYLGGQSSQAGLKARARCVTNAVGDSYEHTWNQGATPKSMGAVNADRACFLTRVSGKFAGGTERVEIFTSAGSWYLGGASLQVGVSARARCISAPPGGIAYKWAGLIAPSTILTPSVGYACFLAGMAGRFDAVGDFVAVNRGRPNWLAVGDPTQKRYAKGGCVQL